MNSMIENLKVINILDTVDIGTGGPNYTDYVDMTNILSGMFVFEASGAFTDAIDICKLVQASDSGGTGVKDVPNAAIDVTPVIELADHDRLIIEIDPRGLLDLDNGFNWVAMAVDTDGAGSSLGNAYFIGIPRYASRALNGTVADTNSIKVPKG